MLKQIPYLDLIDQPEWRGLSPAPSTHSTGASLAGDFRSESDADPNLLHTIVTGKQIGRANV